MSSKYSKDQVETVLRTAVTNTQVNQASLRRLPTLTDDPSAFCDLTDALQAMDAAIYNLHKYAAKAEITIQNSMPT